MKELRFGWQGEVWRVAFAFDPDRQAILLVDGDKGDADQKRFYKRLIGLADAPNRPPVIIEQIAEPRGQRKQSAKGLRTGKRHVDGIDVDIGTLRC